MRIFPETSLAKTLHKNLVEEPVGWLGRMERKHWLFAGVALLFMLSGVQLLLVLGSIDAAVAVARSTSLYLDAAVATWTVAATASMRGTWALIKGRSLDAVRKVGRVCSPRAIVRRKRTKKTSATNDDGRPIALVLAA